MAAAATRRSRALLRPTVPPLQPPVWAVRRWGWDRSTRPPTVEAGPGRSGCRWTISRSMAQQASTPVWSFCRRRSRIAIRCMAAAGGCRWAGHPLGNQPRQWSLIRPTEAPSASFEISLELESASVKRGRPMVLLKGTDHDCCFIEAPAFLLRST